jgi:hypothetical protein
VRAFPVAVAVIVVLAVFGIVLALTLPGGSDEPSDSGGGSPSARLQAPKLADQTRLKRHRETADVRAGIALYRDARGTQADARSIPIGTVVTVVCQTPNHSGIASINAFYLLETSPWKGLLASANQFANGAPVGVTTNSNAIDASVEPCRTPK